MTEEQPLSQAELIQLLQQTIKQLDHLVNRLNLETPETLPSPETVRTLVATTEVLTASLPATSTPEKPSAKSQPAAKKQEPPLEVSAELITEEESLATSWIDRHLPSFGSLQAWWDGILARIRSFLPSRLSEKLSDWGLTGILATLVVVVLLTSVLLLPQAAPKIAENPVENPVENPTEVTENLEIEPIETPFELTSPGVPEPVILEPPPGPQLTPEQSLIAAIQEEVGSITRQYPPGLIASIEANFPVSRLTIIVGENWYSLNAKRQDKLANTILERAKTLDFQKLELINAEGTLVARNPFVGKKMVILLRTQS